MFTLSSQGMKGRDHLGWNCMGGGPQREVHVGVRLAEPLIFMMKHLEEGLRQAETPQVPELGSDWAPGCQLAQACPCVLTSLSPTRA